jgi:hypothetical protein
VEKSPSLRYKKDIDMRTLFLTLMMSFLSHSAFGAGEGEGEGGGGAGAAGALGRIFLVEEVTIEEIHADIEEMMNVPGFNKFFDIIITATKEKTDDPDIQEVGSISHQHNLTKEIKRNFDSLSLDDLMGQEFDLGLGLKDIITINLSRSEKIPHVDIIIKLSITPEEYGEALEGLDLGVEELSASVFGGLADPSARLEEFGDFFASQQREGAEGDEAASVLGTKKTRTCGQCQKEEESMKRCSGCGTVYYCSSKCQKDHWKLHKPNCKKSPDQEEVTSGPGFVEECIRNCKK